MLLYVIESVDEPGVYFNLDGETYNINLAEAFETEEEALATAKDWLDDTVVRVVPVVRTTVLSE